MKKMLICCGVLCMTLLLFCGSAFAAVTVTGSDDTVEVTVDEAVPAITVKKTEGVDASNLYLVMVQEGTAPPDSQNLYYLNVERQSSAPFEMKAYPKDTPQEKFLTEGKTYTVYLSDWSESGNGARKPVATLNVGGVTPDNPGGDNPGGSGGDIGANPGEYQCGDVNHSGGKPDNRDVRDLARYVGKWPDYLVEGKIDLSLADVNASGGLPNNRDVRDLARYVGKWPDYPTLPHTGE